MRRTGLLCRAGGWLALGLLTGSAAGAVTKTYQNTTDLSVPCATSTTSNIVVPDLGTITDLNVIDITHKSPYLGRLTYTLTDPTGAVTVVVKDSGSGGTGDGMTNIDFDDAAASSFPSFLSDGNCLSNTTYQPHGNLSDFNGLQVNGTWTLTISDSSCAGLTDCDCSIASGPACPRQLENWGMEITFTLPPCDLVTVANQTIGTMQTRQACRLLRAGPALTIATGLGATLVAGETVVLRDGVTVNSSASLTVGTCGLDICTTGPALTAACAPCVTTICGTDPFCCTTSWDLICVGEVGSLCGLGCP